jgi:D-alanyl-lipoteichoic acid acyltransferase DltB (MBOAT superfamily)
VNLAWIFFRALSWGDAMKVLKGMFGLSGTGNPMEMPDIGGNYVTYLWIIAGFGIIFLIKNTNEVNRSFKPSWLKLAILLIIAVYSIMNMHRISEFIYFGF